MRAALKLLLITGLMAGAACHKQDKAPPEQNVTIDSSGNIPEGADVETLPPDESSGDSSNELETGEDNPDVNDASVNAY